MIQYFGIPCYASPTVLKENIVYHTDVDVILYCSVLETYVTFHVYHDDDFDKYFSMGKGYWPESYEGVYWNKLPYIPILIKAGANYSFTGTTTLRVIYFPLVMDYGTIEQIPSIAGINPSSSSGSSGDATPGTGDTPLVTPGTVVFESSIPGEYNIVIPMDGNYRITAVGGGGGGAAYMYCYSNYISYWYAQAAGGGAGAYFDGIYTLTTGAIGLTVGSAGGSATAQWVNKNSKDTSGRATGGNGGNTTVGGFLVAHGGVGGITAYKTATGGSAGNLEYTSENLVETYIATATNDSKLNGKSQVVSGSSVNQSSSGNSYNSQDYTVTLTVAGAGGSNGSPNLAGAGGGASGTACFVQNGRQYDPAATTNATGGNPGYIKIVKI